MPYTSAAVLARSRVISARWGGAFTPLVVVWVLTFMSWRETFTMFGLIGIVWAFFFYRWFRDDPRQHPSVNAAELKLIGETTPVGAFEGGKSPFGLYDVSGNVWEWTSTPNPERDNFFFVAGGNWDAAEKGTCGLAKYSFYPQNAYPGVGFRCCADVK